jgi:hypothetical protein
VSRVLRARRLIESEALTDGTEDKSVQVYTGISVMNDHGTCSLRYVDEGAMREGRRRDRWECDEIRCSVKTPQLRLAQRRAWMCN